MGVLLPVELMQMISAKCPCRDSQIRQLATYYNHLYPSPPVLVAYGLETTSKLDVIRQVLQRRSMAHAVVRSQDCLNQRHLLSKIFAGIVTAAGLRDQAAQFGRIDSINALFDSLGKIFEQEAVGRLVLVVDGIDRQRGASSTLLPALARLGDMIPKLSLILTADLPRPLPLHRSGIPSVSFPPYTRSEAVHILTRSDPPLPPTTSSLPAAVKLETLKRIYAQFALTVYDSLTSHTSVSLTTFASTVNKLWPRFIQPMIGGEAPPGRAGSSSKEWDFAKLLVRNRALFHATGELALSQRLSALKDSANDDANTNDSPTTTTPTPASTPIPASSLATPRVPLLGSFAALLLLATYLTSHTPPKHDILLFSRLSTSASTSRKLRRLKNNPKPSSSAAASGASSTGRVAKTPPAKLRANSVFNQVLHIPRPSALERVVAVLRAVHPDGVPIGKAIVDRVAREMAELERLRLVVRVVGEDGGGGTGGGERWRVNVGREWVGDVAGRYGMVLGEWEVEADV